MLAVILTAIVHRLPSAPDDDSGFSTAELLGNAALGIAALAVIWTGLQQLGVDVVAQMRTALGL